MNTKGWHESKWSSKCQAFFDAYEAITAAHYPLKSILNIGVGPNLEAIPWNTFLSKIWPSVESFHNLEITKGGVENARASDNPLVNQITHGDVKDCLDVFNGRSFDLIFWNQGPEHIYREEWEECFANLASIASKAIYIHTPWGSGYDYDQWHFSKDIKRGEFESHGFTCRYHGKENTKDAGIIGWKLV